jgi:hypothetical protein
VKRADWRLRPRASANTATASRGAGLRESARVAKDAPWGRPEGPRIGVWISISDATSSSPSLAGTLLIVL